MKRFSALFIFMVLLTFNLQYTQAQETNTSEEDELSLDKGPISSQFEFITDKSGNYRSQGKVYEVVRSLSLDKLRKNVLDSLAANRKKEADLNKTISEHEATISSLNEQLDSTSAKLSNVTEEKDNISLLGIPVSKSTYNLILWSIIIGLLVLLLFFIYKFRNSNALTQDAKNNLSELEEEYEQHRRRALEREQKISRQLQDELNKQKKSK